MAREELCRVYWYPLYAYIKRSGLHEGDAEDLTQEFFADILQRPWFERADQSKGKFRSFLLASLNNFLRDCADRKKALKRGGAYQHIPLDMGSAASRYSQSEAASFSPTEVYEVEWASAIVTTALKRLENEFLDAGKELHYQHLKVFLTSESGAGSYDNLAKILCISVGNIKAIVHRLRKRYGAILREEVARTIATSEDIEDEMRHMRAIFAAT